MKNFLNLIRVLASLGFFFFYSWVMYQINITEWYFLPVLILGLLTTWGMIVSTLSLIFDL